MPTKTSHNCPSCQLKTTRAFTSEIAIHFGGLARVGGVYGAGKGVARSCYQCSGRRRGGSSLPIKKETFSVRAAFKEESFCLHSHSDR